MTHQELKEKLFSDPKFKEAYENSDIFIEIAFAIKEMRYRHGFSQKILAKKTGLQQEAIARLEKPGYSIKYLRNLEKLAKAFGTKLLAPKFKELLDEEAKKHQGFNALVINRTETAHSDSGNDFTCRKTNIVNYIN